MNRDKHNQSVKRYRESLKQQNKCLICKEPLPKDCKTINCPDCLSKRRVKNPKPAGNVTLAESIRRRMISLDETEQSQLRILLHKIFINV